MVTWKPLVAAAAITAIGAASFAQSNPFQFVVAVSDGAGNPVVDLTSKDVLMSEDGVSAEVTRVEPFRRPGGADDCRG